MTCSLCAYWKRTTDQAGRCWRWQVVVEASEVHPCFVAKVQGETSTVQAGNMLSCEAKVGSRLALHEDDSLTQVRPAEFGSECPKGSPEPSTHSSPFSDRSFEPAHGCAGPGVGMTGRSR